MSMFNRKHFFTFPYFESFMGQRLLFELNNRKLLELSVKLSWIPRLFESFPAKTLIVWSNFDRKKKREHFQLNA